MKTPNETDQIDRLTALAAEIDCVSTLLSRSDVEQANGLSFLIGRWASDLRLIAAEGGREQ